MEDPHRNEEILRSGVEPAVASVCVVLVHGRGSSAQDILPLSDEFEIKNLCSLAPQAAGNTWYPYSFLAPVEQNEPYLSSALARLSSVVSSLVKENVPYHKIALLGFSQGACLVSEFIARHPRRYAAAMLLSGGVIGPPGTVRDYPGSLDGTPIFLGACDPDPHVPFLRVAETEAIFRKMGARIHLERYPGVPHSITEDEISRCRALLQSVAEGD
jgi:predicted esterase